MVTVKKILGKALEGMNREDVKIITKCGVTWDQEMKGDLFNKVNGIQLYKNLNSESVKKEIEASLERLGTDYVDVYMTLASYTRNRIFRSYPENNGRFK